jgi:putative chitinase
MDINKLMVATGASTKDATKFYEIIDPVLLAYQITTPTRISAFLAQVGHESGGLHYLKEIWGPTPAQTGYEGRLDLGNVVKGDGKKFMGRGLLQTTGRANYTKCGTALYLDLVNHPELLEVPENALKSACQFWKDNNLNALADSGSFKALTKKINGGYNGLEERTTLYNKAVTVFV